MKKLFSILLVFLLFFTLLITPSQVNARDTYSKAAEDLRMAERKLWSDHAIWTRNFIISDISNLPDKNDVLDRLLRNQDDIGASIKPYYGEEAGNALAKLLREHISLAGQVVDAAKTGNSADFDKFNKLWYENADQIAKFLSNANPKLPYEELKDMLHKHLQILTEEVTARLNSNWKGNIAAFDKGIDHLLMLADTISNGIIKQFPRKFK